MKHLKQEKVQIDLTTGEVYTCYPRTEKKETGFISRFVRWLLQMVDSHFDRLIELRVYDDRRFDYRIKK